MRQKRRVTMRTEAGAKRSVGMVRCRVRGVGVITLLALLLAVSGGCTRMPGGVAASDVPVAPGSYRVIGDTKASDCKVNLLGLIPLSGGNRLDQAMEKARRRRSADALIGITVDRDTKFFILWSQTCTVVRATAVELNG